jgi:hypothetical protein
VHRRLSKLLIALLSVIGTSTAQSAPVQWSTSMGGNGHWYDFVAGEFSWQQAADDAATKTHGTLTGYLATITSAAENAFLVSVSGGFGWLGASDAANEGNWIWQTGPEAGSALTYFNWYPGEPNNANNEDYLQISPNWVGGEPGMWNDNLGGPDFNVRPTEGYFVEFGPTVPEPASLLLTALGLASAFGSTLRGRRQSAKLDAKPAGRICGQ